MTHLMTGQWQIETLHGQLWECRIVVFMMKVGGHIIWYEYENLLKSIQQKIQDSVIREIISMNAANKRAKTRQSVVEMAIFAI